MNCICGKELKPFASSGRYPSACSTTCRDRARYLERRVLKPRTPKPPSRCKGCGCDFRRTNLSSRDAKKYCTRECAFEHDPYYNSDAWARAVGDGMLFVLKKWVRLEKQAPSKLCRACGEVLVREPGKILTSYCRLCMQNKVRTRKRAENRIRKKRLRSVRIESFGRNEIFRRDEWKCQECGIHVSLDCDPNDDHRASLDHVIPLAKGGKHTRANCQCLCRMCNSIKRDTVGVRQLSLIG